MKYISLYIHIPFCESKCYYCDFTSFTGRKNRVEDYIKALVKEVRSYGDILKEYKVRTIFFGGGTPSSINWIYIKKIMDAINRAFDTSEIKEISLEANPGTLTEEKLEGYNQIGINRISMGAQSFNDKILKDIGRIHNSKDIYKSIEIIRQAGINNINLDLMFGLPNQTMEDVVFSLEEAINLKLNHISYYSLIIEENTKMHSLYREKDWIFPSEELDRKMYHRTREILRANGFNHYEISNYGKYGYESLHNLAYWNLEEYLGLGLGSHSNLRGQRFSNTHSLSEYIDNIENNREPVVERENIDLNTAIIEYSIMGIRKIKGIDKLEFEKRFNRKFEDIYRKSLIKNQDRGLLINSKDYVYLTKKGLDLANQVELDFLL